MYRRAIVALDGSQVAETILPFIFDLAGPLEVTLVRVNVPVRPTIVEGAAQPIFEDPEVARIDAEEYLAPLAADLRRRGIHVKTQVRKGEAAEEILKAARELNADVIAMTTHGRRGLGRLFFGSVAETVLRESELPVLLMRATEADVARLAKTASPPATTVTREGGRG
ncbi:MAG TPA: universal stress protein [Terriglobales bacterium]|nr:universal stress protein [Terriglobales bacterium]